jgi:hypothetical protein
MKILFCHGLEGGPSGNKATVLRAAGHEVLAPSLPKEDLERAVGVVREALSGFEPDVLIGSSRGGAIAMRAASQTFAPLVLLAPAWRHCGVEPVVRGDTRILHGIKDDVVPLADSIELETRNGLPAGNLIPVNDGHRLSSSLGLAALLSVVGEIAPASAARQVLGGNQIKVIKPYKWEGLWVFDDPAVGLYKEALVAGMPEMIELAAERAGIAHPEKGFVALFSKDPFPGAMVSLELVGEDLGGHIYRWPDAGLEGWLCPALFKYFDHAPPRLYIELRSAGSKE